MTTNNRFLKLFSSLQLTVVLLVLVMILVFWGTLAQVEQGLYIVQKHFFESWIVMLDTPLGFKVPVLPGGRTLGLLLLINLILAHSFRFKWSWKKVGIWLTHIGLILLLIGSGITSFFAVESQMAIQEGESKNYTASLDQVELAIVSPVNDTEDEIVSIPQSLISGGKEAAHAQLPFTLKILNYWPNAHLQMNTTGQKPLVNQGIGAQLSLTPLPYNTKSVAENAQTAVVEVMYNNQSMGTLLLSSKLGAPQSLLINGKSYTFFIRPKRYYLPYTVKLLDFKHDVYPGTTIPKNFSSQVQVQDGKGKTLTEYLIFMNNPLRYQGKTYYQASFGNNDTLSVFQVVENLGWTMPYISSLIMALGLLIQFGISLWAFASKRRAL
jgi:hypothetical protein